MASLVKNIVFNVIYKIANIVFPLITTVYVSHVLLAGGVGKVSVAQNIAQYFVLLAPLGIVNYGTREIAKLRDNKQKTDILFSELFYINAISTIICSLSYYYLIFSSGYFTEELLLFSIAGLSIIFNIINVDWFYQGKEEYVYISIRSIAIKLISILLIILFVKSSDDYLIYACIYVFGLAGNYIFNVFHLLKDDVKFVYHDIKFKSHLKATFVLLCSTIAIELYTLVDTTMLGYFCDDEIVGYFANAAKLDRIIVGLISAIGTVLLPRLSYYISNNQIENCNKVISSVIMVMAFLALPCGIGMFMLADSLVVVLFGGSFIPAIATVKIGTMLIYILSFSNLFGTQVLLSFSQEKKLLLCTLIGAALNISMNLVLIPLYQHNGAMIASVASEVAVLIISFIFARKYIHITVPAKFWWSTITSVVIMGCVIYLLDGVIENIYVNILITIIAGAIVYFIGVLLTKSPLIPVLNKLINK